MRRGIGVGTILGCWRCRPAAPPRRSRSRRAVRPHRAAAGAGGLSDGRAGARARRALHGHGARRSRRRSSRASANATSCASRAGRRPTCSSARAAGASARCRCSMPSPAGASSTSSSTTASTASCVSGRSPIAPRAAIALRRSPPRSRRDSASHSSSAADERLRGLGPHARELASPWPDPCGRRCRRRAPRRPCRSPRASFAIRASSASSRLRRGASATRRSAAARRSSVRDAPAGFGARPARLPAVEIARQDEPAVIVHVAVEGLHACRSPTSQSRSAQASIRKRSWLTRITAPVEVVDRLDQGGAAVDVEVVRRLVEDQEMRAVEGGEAHEQPRLLAARQVPRPASRPSAPEKPNRAARARTLATGAPGMRARDMVVGASRPGSARRPDAGRNRPRRASASGASRPRAARGGRR